MLLFNKTTKFDRPIIGEDKKIIWWWLTTGIIIATLTTFCKFYFTYDSSLFLVLTWTGAFRLMNVITPYIKTIQTPISEKELSNLQRKYYDKQKEEDEENKRNKEHATFG